MPYGIYSIPEISMVGPTEAELTKEGVPYAVGRAQYREIARGQILGDRTGMLKLLFHPSSLEHDTGPDHPERPSRASAVHERVRVTLGLVSAGPVRCGGRAQGLQEARGVPVALLVQCALVLLAARVGQAVARRCVRVGECGHPAES